MTLVLTITDARCSGRWPHAHLEVHPDAGSITDASNAVATSQVVLPENLCDAACATGGHEASVPDVARVSLTRPAVGGHAPRSTSRSPSHATGTGSTMVPTPSAVLSKARSPQRPERSRTRRPA